MMRESFATTENFNEILRQSPQLPGTQNHTLRSKGAVELSGLQREALRLRRQSRQSLELGDCDATNRSKPLLRGNDRFGNNDTLNPVNGDPIQQETLRTKTHMKYHCLLLISILSANFALCDQCKLRFTTASATAVESARAVRLQIQRDDKPSTAIPFTLELGQTSSNGERVILSSTAMVYPAMTHLMEVSVPLKLDDQVRGGDRALQIRMSLAEGWTNSSFFTNVLLTLLDDERLGGAVSVFQEVSIPAGYLKDGTLVALRHSGYSNELVRVHSDGIVEPGLPLWNSFQDPIEGVDRFQLTALSDGGCFLQCERLGNPPNCGPNLRRITADWQFITPFEEIDPTFTVREILELPDKSLLVSGTAPSTNSAGRLRHLTSSGARIPGFELPSSLSHWRLLTFLTLSDGDILGAFQSADTKPLIQVVRLNKDGSVGKVLLTPRFIPYISQLIELPEGRILAVDWQFPVQGALNLNSGQLFCILPQGGIDPSFGGSKDGFLKFDGYISRVSFDGRWIYLVNHLYPGTPPPRRSLKLTRFDLHGVRDPLFEPPLAYWPATQSGLTISPQGDLTTFCAFGGSDVLVNLRTELPARLSIAKSSDSGVSLEARELTPGYRYRVERTRDLDSWESLTTIDTAGPDWATGLPADLPQASFRLRVVP